MLQFYANEFAKRKRAAKNANVGEYVATEVKKRKMALETFTTFASSFVGKCSRAVNIRGKTLHFNVLVYLF